ncbi:hypothetical protein HYV85_04565 [Candidatus Woesearchaeota archaeon]|nr:hypothetical protein [Candidatus Woesearchaeota archaeon]
MLISDKFNSVIRVLLINSLEGQPNLTLSQLSKKANVFPSMAKKLVLKLIRSEYATIGKGIRGIKITNPLKLMKAWGYCYSIRELDKAEFVAAERPQYVMVKIANIAKAQGLKYAFTVFSATEHVSPYVAPSATHLYVLKKDIKEWQHIFFSQNILQTEDGGNVICLLVDEEYFEGVWNSREMMVVSLPQLYADLFSYGGRGEEAADEILSILSRKLNNV